MSKLYFTYSAMNAGKSAILLQAAYNYGERGMSVMLWTSGHHGSENAETGKIESRIGLEAEAHLFRSETDLYSAISKRADDAPLHAVFVDEAQFLNEDQVWQLARVGDEMRLPVLCYGLRTDFQGELFEGAAALLAIADDLREARTICHCGRKATMTARLDENGNAIREGDQVSVAKGIYVSLCRQHWNEKVRGVTG
ncbi:thymidine kinase [Ponticaulis sp.]|uniref:thymidine kinase n=1 Tax=Ponticaulis sp. TaxID=2020902 RepID=UPI000B66A993|nr:thymidine kinase [Ponticaulis sp.]MAJ07939.1 thymidine kinase [Ponticaulis sp.]RPG18249.1 MAG: thymidine kinase [Hyphomonadaceae bacterium TMED125]HBJ92625.1 thymidine kinase [Hyphomonadaceae bacterium]|tara:strand:+ start:32155 stop:32745 length:591 start_codon:yes stop_codon:yes gene_type:complete